MLYLPVLAFGLLFAYYLYNLISDINYLSGLKEWKKISAKIKDARIINEKSKSFKNINISNIYFFCTYTIDDVDYGSSTVSLIKSPKSLLRKNIRRIVKKEECEIYYNPERPHESSLINPASYNFFFSYIKLIFLFAMFILSIYFNMAMTYE